MTLLKSAFDALRAVQGNSRTASEMELTIAGCAWWSGTPTWLYTANSELCSIGWVRTFSYAKQHARTLDSARRAGLVSAYHHHSGEAQGVESTPTLYWRGAGQKTYHIDYAFIPDAWLPRLREVNVGSKEDWIDSGLSDHIPLVVDIADN